MRATNPDHPVNRRPRRQGKVFPSRGVFFKEIREVSIATPNSKETVDEFFRVALRLDRRASRSLCVRVLLFCFYMDV